MLENERSWEFVARQAVRFWEGDAESLCWVGLSESAVYTFLQGDRKRYLRLTAPEHRSGEQIEAELAFVSYLHEGGARVSRPLVSQTGRRVEPIPAGAEEGPLHLYSTCVFEEAEGIPFQYTTSPSTETHFRALGRTFGRIHALSQRYRPDSICRRFAWHEDASLMDIEQFLPPSETVIWQEIHFLLKWLNDQPQTQATFGLIHGDLGATNYRCHDSEITVFDFDDCCYHWYVYDLAIALYPHGWRPEAERLYAALVEGYSLETAWDGRPLSEITNWCRLRMLFMFLHHARKWGWENLTDYQKEWMQHKRENIARGYIWG
jgi:amicoumacin kinase